jgi:PTS system galactitol-specific IIC component
MVEQTGINLPVVDLGWPPLSAITWGSPIAPFVIPLTMLINVIMIAIKQTRTVDVDMWNYWHFASFVGSIANTFWKLSFALGRSCFT